MFIENKGNDGLNGPARIGRITYNKSGKTLTYRGRSFQSLHGQGFKANFRDTETGEYYWISGCKISGDDTLYPSIVEIDEDIREEYWLQIRNRPDCVTQSSFRSEGKHSKRKPK